jgi:hypothetical protein
VRDLEEWMRKTRYDGRPRPVLKDRADLRDAGGARYEPQEARH